MNTVYQSIQLDKILFRYKKYLGHDFDSYKNHCYRVLNFALLIADKTKDIEEKASIACAFHDLGIWTHKTFDYIEPSIGLSLSYLKEIGRMEWATEVSLMISEHHKISPFKSEKYVLVESFRKADWIDVSLGFLDMGLNKDAISSIRNQFSNRGFHKRLVELSIKRLITNPLSPLPMFKR